MNPTTIYFAGFFDGEGTVDIRYRKTHKGKYGRFELRVQVAQLDTAPLIEMQGIWGGSICKPKTHNVSRILIAGKQAIKFLADIHPYLRVKKDEVAIALAFANLMNEFEYTFKDGGRGFARETEEKRNMKLFYFHELRYMREKKGLVAHNRNSLLAA